MLMHSGKLVSSDVCCRSRDLSLTVRVALAKHCVLLYHDLKCTIVIGQTRKKADDARLVKHQMLPMMPGIGDSHTVTIIFLNKIINAIFRDIHQM